MNFPEDDRNLTEDCESGWREDSRSGCSRPLRLPGRSTAPAISHLPHRERLTDPTSTCRAGDTPPSPGLQSLPSDRVSSPILGTRAGEWLTVNIEVGVWYHRKVRSYPYLAKTRLPSGVQ